MVSVIIAAHNEEGVLGATLDALLAQPGIAADRVIVSANGCRWNTLSSIRAEMLVRKLSTRIALRAVIIRHHRHREAGRAGPSSG